MSDSDKQQAYDDWSDRRNALLSRFYSTWVAEQREQVHAHRVGLLKIHRELMELDGERLLPVLQEAAVSD